jgi:hypothetical protein
MSDRSMLSGARHKSTRRRTQKRGGRGRLIIRGYRRLPEHTKEACYSVPFSNNSMYNNLRDS